uniref:Glycosyltransferase 2-like domain-containing protein n=1 Tax=Rhodosorus marinus TaxID=101924 RepID=A0A7S2ZQS4_9RHOD|mmetsp:Transcript_25658/g.101189  ORF Transcript_25658/g.101189 Transcript_25658/m.101189 type:complete len:241 (+) Transcript_25658:674-1396(+)|eukprot:CAMPEP_0113969182 /NCGR_PEP_ID=MMETSP0011_2-20120614/10082_1 /TAXON_ID=101924 /ORGANISM="Rhodosorus marinus" /LENGTH=240 /DNA_ID=CAMNT_0000982625 /DNA_START=179 /DNA_END=901 /DNA_ORIENTATION=+ /assembly_acc=CAM_ASM_000156
MRDEVISVIIPTLNEEGSIASTIKELREGVVQKDTRLDVVVADGGSADGTKRLVKAGNARWVQAGRGRGTQLNAAVPSTEGAFLIFLHADTRLPVGFDRVVRSTLRDETVSLGAFRLKIDSNVCGIRLVEAVANLRSRLLGMPYGDQGFFIRRSTFDELGGFPDMPLMEDFQMARNAKRLGRVITAKQSAVTSGRRWEEFGVFRTTALNQIIVAGFYLGVPVETLNKWYRGATARSRRRE